MDLKSNIREHEPSEPISRTRKKKAAIDLQKMGETLASMTEGQLSGLELPGPLDQALNAFRGMKKHEARRRQLQYIGKLMRQVDTAEIERFLEDAALRDYETNRRMRQMEQWRDEIVTGDDSRIGWLLDTYPDLFDRQQLTQLARNARKEVEEQKPPKAARKLFRYLRDAFSGIPFE